MSSQQPEGAGILVTAIPGNGDDADAARRLRARDEVGDHLQSGDVMGIVHDDLPSGDVEQVETAWCLRKVGRELTERIADAFELHVTGNGGGRGSERVGDVGPDAAAQSGRDFRREEQARLLFVLEQASASRPRVFDAARPPDLVPAGDRG